MKINFSALSFALSSIIGVLGYMPVAFAAPYSPSSRSEAAIANVLDHYWSIEQSLSQDTLVGVKEKAELMIPAARRIEDSQLSAELQKEAAHLATASGEASGHGSIGDARGSFKAMSGTLSKYIQRHPQKDWQVFNCPMAKSDWIQKINTEIQNPFYGKAMIACGAKVQKP